MASLRNNLLLIFVDLGIHLAAEKIFFSELCRGKSVHKNVLTFFPSCSDFFPNKGCCYMVQVPMGAVNIELKYFLLFWTLNHVRIE